MPLSVSVSPLNEAVIGAWLAALDSASTSWAAAKLLLIWTVAPVIVPPTSGSVTVSAGAIGVAGSFSV